MGSRVELFEQIRRDHDREGLSTRALANRHRVHRRTVRQALASAVPPPRKQPAKRPAPVLGRWHGLIDSWLDDDRDAPPKQRHTARRVWERLVTEHDAKVAERTVRQYVARRRRELGLDLDGQVPQQHDPGAEAQVDWGTADVWLAGDLIKVKLFLMRLSHSGAEYVEAFPREIQQAFLEGHANAFAFFDGVPALIRYDNLKAAVERIMRGRRRIETDRFVALRSHYLFEAFYCRPGKRGSHEKGGVEGEVGRFRRNNLVPVPKADSFIELNAFIQNRCERDLTRRITGRELTVGQLLARERRVLRPLPGERFDGRETSTVRVGAKALVTVRQNQYSVPAQLIGRQVTALIGARRVEIAHGGKVVAEHERLRGRYATCARLVHYAPLLRRAPGALAGSVALAQERERGQWPGCFDELWRLIEERTTPSEAASQMVDVLLLCSELGAERVELAVRGALAAGAHDGRAVAVLARKSERGQAEPITELPAGIARAQAEEPDLAQYDAMLGGGR
jgi:transposase